MFYSSCLLTFWTKFLICRQISQFSGQRESAVEEKGLSHTFTGFFLKLFQNPTWFFPVCGSEVEKPQKHKMCVFPAPRRGRGTMQNVTTRETRQEEETNKLGSPQSFTSRRHHCEMRHQNCVEFERVFHHQCLQGISQKTPHC